MENKENKKIERFLDKTLSLSIRRVSFEDHMKKVMNPIPQDKFDPKNFDPIEDPELDKEVYARERKKHVGRLPTNMLEPKVIREGQMIGMYESKQDLYLLFAHKINDLEDLVESLVAEINTLKKKIK